MFCLIPVVCGSALFQLLWSLATYCEGVVRASLPYRSGEGLLFSSARGRDAPGCVVELVTGSPTEAKLGLLNL